MKQIERKNDFQIQIFPQEKNISNKKEVGSANMLLNQLPSLVGAKELAGAYKVVFPPDVAGTLMELKNGANAGLLTTTIKGDFGRFAGQAGLKSLSNVANPLAVFSLMSLVTGQYFMAQINESLKAVSKNIEQVQRQIDTSEESVVFSSSIFLQEIKNDWALILQSEELKSSVVSNIMKSVNDLTASIYYFENIINQKTTELENILRKNKIAELSLINEISRNKDFMKLAYETRSCLKLILIYLTCRLTKNNVEDVKEALKRDDDLLFSSTVKQLESRIDVIINILKNAPNEKLQKQAFEIKSVVLGVREITRDRFNNMVKANIDSTIDKIKEIDEKGQTFYIENNKIYIEETE